MLTRKIYFITLNLLLILGMIACSDSKSTTDPGGGSDGGIAAIIDLIDSDKFDATIFVIPNNNEIVVMPLNWGTYTLRINGANVPLEQEDGQLIGHFVLGFNPGQTYHFILNRNGVDTHLSLTVPAPPVVTFPNRYSSMQNYTLNWTLPQNCNLQIFAYGYEKYGMLHEYYCWNCWYWEVLPNQNNSWRCPRCNSNNFGVWSFRGIIDSGYFYRTLSAATRTFTLEANNMPTNQDEYTFILGSVNFNTMGRVSIISGNGVGATYDGNGNLIDVYSRNSEGLNHFDIFNFLK